MSIIECALLIATTVPIGGTIIVLTFILTLKFLNFSHNIVKNNRSKYKVCTSIVISLLFFIVTSLKFIGVIDISWLMIFIPLIIFILWYIFISTVLLINNIEL